MRRALPAATLLTTLLLALPAAAHHPTGGMMPESFLGGFLSGLGHPVLGLDHLAFLVAVGLATGLAGLSLWVPTAFVVASLFGVAVHVAVIDIPAVEALVAGSVAIAGALLLRGRHAPATAWAVLAALAGLVHGHAYGEAVAGAEATPILAYLLGLAVLQGAMVLSLAMAAAKGKEAAQRLLPRYAGAAVLAVGVVTLLTGALPGG
jgi:urease accessory protein